MASKSKHKTKGLGADPSLSKMGQRLITTMLREERVAERDLQEKLKAISEKEHKTMVKLGCDSLDVRHDLTLHRSSSPLPWEHKDNSTAYEDVDGKRGRRESPSDLGDSLSRPRLGRRAVSMLTYSTNQENVLLATEIKRTNSEEVKSNYKTTPKSPTILVEKHTDDLVQEKPEQHKLCNSVNSGQMKNLSLGNLIDSPKMKSTCEGRPNSPSARSPRLLRRRPVSDISSSSVTQPSLEDNGNIFVEHIPLGKGVCSDRQLMSKSPSTPPPVRRNVNSLSADTTKPRPSSARSVRSRALMNQNPTVRGMESQRLDLPQSVAKARSRSPSPSRLAPDTSMKSRRGSAPSKIDASALPTTSILRKSLGTNDVNQSLRPASPDALRKRLSSNEEDLQDRVSVFLKSLQKK